MLWVVIVFPGAVLWKLPTLERCILDGHLRGPGYFTVTKISCIFLYHSLPSMTKPTPIYLDHCAFLYGYYGQHSSTIPVNISSIL